MKSCYLDSNILISLKDEISPFHKPAKKLLKELTKNSFRLYISPLVLDEFLFQIKFILQKKKRMIFKKYATVFRQVLRLPDLYLINPPIEKKKQLKVLSLMKDFKLRPRDAYHLLIMKENKIKYFATFDNDFKIAFKKKVVLAFLPST